MTMPKRSMAELRKLRKRDEILVTALSEIKATNDGESDQPIGDIVNWCLDQLKEIEEKERFLQKLELPSHEADADEILRKIRERQKQTQQKKHTPIIADGEESTFDQLKKYFGIGDE